VRFYEIDPQVVRIARGRFTYLEDTAAAVEVVLGDARVSLEREEPQRYDILVLDAFSGDSIPVHLLTREAMEIYRKHVVAGGLIAVHVSNQYLGLAPVVRGLAAEAGFESRLVEDWRAESVVDDDPEQAKDDRSRGLLSSDWVLVTEDRAFFDDEEVEEAANDPEEDGPPAPAWTDDRNDLLGVLKN
jgi:hypothetical protein